MDTRSVSCRKLLTGANELHWSVMDTTRVSHNEVVQYRDDGIPTSWTLKSDRDVIDGMSSGYDIVEGLIPDFRKERRKRNEVRSQCRVLLNGLDSGGTFELIDTEERELCYLSDEAEKCCVEAEHVLKENCSRPSNHSIRFAPSELDDEAKQEATECLNEAIEAINKQNKWSKWGERGLIGFIVIVLGASVALGLVGLDVIVGVV